MLAHHQKKKSTVKPGDGNVGRLFSTGKIVFKKQFRSTQQVKDYFFDSFQEAKNQADSEVIHFAKPSDQNQHPESKHLGGYKELLESGWWGTVLEPPKMKKKKGNKTPTSNTKDLPTKIFQVVWLFSFLSKNQKCSTSLRFSVHLEVFGCLHAADTMRLLEPQHSCGGWSPIPCNFMSNSQVEKTISLTLPKLGCENDFLDFSI